MGICALPGGYVPVGFTIFGIIDSNFVVRLSSIVYWLGSSSVSVNFWWLDLPWCHIIGW